MPKYVAFTDKDGQTTLVRRWIAFMVDDTKPHWVPEQGDPAYVADFPDPGSAAAFMQGHLVGRVSVAMGTGLLKHTHQFMKRVIR